MQLSWELDLWGRLRRLNEAARAQYLATEEARNGVIISLISDVMTTYFALREQDLELEIGRQNNGIARDNLRLIQLRKDRGAANGLEVHQAEQFLYTTTAQIASVERSIAQTEDALNLLLANAPTQVPRGETLEQIASPPELPAGLPSSLIERRPDIRQAEQNLIAANAQIGAARALFFPEISLTGFLGSQSRSLAGMFSGPARLESLAPTALLPIFHAGLRSGVRLTEAQEREMLLAYQKSIYSALREVADALAAHERVNSAGKKRNWWRRCLKACGCRSCAIAEVWTAICRCWMRSGTCSPASWLWRSCGCWSCSRWCSCIARWAAAGSSLVRDKN